MYHDSGELTGAAPMPADGWMRRIGRRVLDWLRRVDATLALWHFRARSRRELARMDDRLLRDAGIDRSEAYKRFWQP